MSSRRPPRLWEKIVLWSVPLMVGGYAFIGLWVEQQIGIPLKTGLIAVVMIGAAIIIPIAGSMGYLDGRSSARPEEPPRDD